METHGHAGGREKQPVETLVEYGVLGTRYGTAHVPYQVHDSMYLREATEMVCVWVWVWVWGCTYLDLLAQEKLSTHLEVVRHAQSQRGLGWVGIRDAIMEHVQTQTSIQLDVDEVCARRSSWATGGADMALKQTRGGPPCPAGRCFQIQPPPPTARAPTLGQPCRRHRHGRRRRRLCGICTVVTGLQGASSHGQLPAACMSSLAPLNARTATRQWSSATSRTACTVPRVSPIPS